MEVYAAFQYAPTMEKWQDCDERKPKPKGSAQLQTNAQTWKATGWVVCLKQELQVHEIYHEKWKHENACCMSWSEVDGRHTWKGMTS